ncbi:MAG: GAF domain-containing protein [Caldilineaceae bacterium]|nr:GAF domain-containing protein [Caldilineaceae bacterium]
MAEFSMNVPALVATYQLRQREFLLQISRAMTSRLDLPSLLRLILQNAAEIVGCRAGLIALTREHIDIGDMPSTVVHFEARGVYNIDPALLASFAPLLTIDAVPVAADDGGNDSHLPDLQERVRQVEAELGMTLGQVVGLPLLFEEQLLGIIYLFRSDYAFTQADAQLLQGFANQAAIAVRNARLYQQVGRERSRLATIIDNSADGIMILDMDLTVLVINQAMAAMVDVTPESAIGLSYEMVLPLEKVEGDDLNAATDLAGLLSDGGARCEGELQRPGGGRIALAVTYTPLYNGGERLVNIIVNVYDITKFREEEEMKSTFTSIISHELKTPVALIKGYAQTLAREDADWDAETARQSLEIIEEEADRLEALINNLLDVSRIQASGLHLDVDLIDLQRLIERVTEVMGAQSPLHTIELDFPAPLPRVWGDAERLRQVLTNLIGNAIKYSPEGGLIRIGGWSETGSGGKRDRVVIYVADEGIGIPAYELPHIFERFYRVDSSLRRSTAGTGLGLFLSKAIVDAHGGEIWVRSESGAGATFFVALPIADQTPAVSPL